VEILSARIRREGAAIFSEDRSKHGTTLRWMALVLSVSLRAVYDGLHGACVHASCALTEACGDEPCPHESGQGK